MPISSDEFNKGRIDSVQSGAIKDFLQKHAENAYTVEELYEGLGGGKHVNMFDTRTGLEIMALQNALFPLLLNGDIEQKFITNDTGGYFYYKYKSNL